MSLPRSPRRDPSSYKKLGSKPPKRSEDPPKAMRVRGASTRSKQMAAWHRELHAEWETRGINYCEVQHEGCMQTFALALAHSRKRRFINDKETYWEVCLACVKCHEWLDNVLSHEEMEAEVKRIIERRNGTE